MLKKFNGVRLEALRKLALYKKTDNGDDLSPTKLAVIMNLSTSSPFFRDVYNYLKTTGILYMTKEFTKIYKFYKINYKKLVELIDEQEESKRWFDYFNYFHLCEY